MSLTWTRKDYPHPEFDMYSLIAKSGKVTMAQLGCGNGKCSSITGSRLGLTNKAAGIDTYKQLPAVDIVAYVERVWEKFLDDAQLKEVG